MLQENLSRLPAILVTKPDFIILDEPLQVRIFRGIRILSELLDYLEERQIGVITITHDMEFVADNFQRVIAMANKKIIADRTAREIFSDDEILQKSKIKRTQIGSIAEELGLGKDILNAREFVES